MTAPRRSDGRVPLAEHRFLSGMDPAFLDLIDQKAYIRSFETGELLVREGDPADEFLLIVSGKVALELVHPDRPRTVIQIVGRGDVVGWSWLLPPHSWRLDARALKPTTVRGLGAAHLRAVLALRPADGYQFLLRLLAVVTVRLEETRRKLTVHHPR